MSPEYKVTLDDESYEVSIEKLDEGGLLIAKVNGESFTIKPTLNEDGSWTVNDTSSDYDIKIIKKTSEKGLTSEAEGPRNRPPNDDIEFVFGGRHGASVQVGFAGIY